MKLLRLEVQRFRGIKSLDWAVGGECVCLVGPGDSTKSTILDAIELVLSPRWNPTLDDSDFFNADTSEPLTICATIGDLPEELTHDNRFGLALRGWSPCGDLQDEPADGDEPVLTIRFRADASLEPTWAVINGRNPEGHPISAKDRERLGCTRLGAFLDRHLTWSRGSVLARLTGEVDQLGHVLAEASRAARRAIGAYELPEPIRKAAKNAQTAAAGMGVSPAVTYRPHLDIQAASVSLGGLALHDGEVPLRRAGMGTRRLVALGLQREAAKAAGLALVDEIEHGLEPHRIRRLLRTLHAGDGGSKPSAHVLMTTHSPTVVGELAASELRVVRSNGGTTTVTAVPPNVQPIVRKAAEAFLGRKIIVCEGRTELGLCRGLNEWWSETGRSFGCLGVALADGRGSEAAEMAVAMQSLGYPVLYLGDSDKPTKPTSGEMKLEGVRVLLWEGNIALEERLALDLPWVGLSEVVAFAVEEQGAESVRDQVADAFGIKSNALPANATDWDQLSYGEDAVRKAIGAAAKRKGWFKRVDLAERVAGVVRKYWATLADKDLGAKVAALQTWVDDG